jgi:hypothetical protein
METIAAKPIMYWKENKTLFSNKEPIDFELALYFIGIGFVLDEIQSIEFLAQNISIIYI